MKRLTTQRPRRISMLDTFVDIMLGLPTTRPRRAEHGGRGYECRQGGPWVAYANSGTSYAVSSEELEILQDRHLASGQTSINTDSPERRLTHNQAYADLSDVLFRTRSPEQVHAQRRLREAWDIPTHQTTPDLYIKVFNDLDRVLFNGTLHGRTSLNWSDLSRRPSRPHSSLLGTTTCYKTRPSRREPSRAWVHIELDKDMFDDLPKDKVWGTLIHEMLHAYISLRLEYGIHDRWKHCTHFNEAAGSAVKVLAFPGLEKYDVVSEIDNEE